MNELDYYDYVSEIDDVFFPLWLNRRGIDIQRLSEKDYIDRVSLEDEESKLLMFYICKNEFANFKKSDACKWLEKAAYLGLAEAEYVISKYIFSGVSSDESLEKQKINYLRNSAEKGLDWAQLALADYYKDQNNFKISKKLYKFSSDQKNPFASIGMAEIYHDQKKYSEAYKMYIKASEQWSWFEGKYIANFTDRIDSAKYQLAIYYATGLGCEKSIDDSVSLFMSIALSYSGGDDTWSEKKWHSKLVLVLMLLICDLSDHINEESCRKILSIFKDSDFLKESAILNNEFGVSAEDFLMLQVKDTKINSIFQNFEKKHRNAILLLANNIASYGKEWESAETLEKKIKEIKIANEEITKKDKELEDIMAMFAHKFRGPLDRIIYNAQHENKVKTYTEAAETMRGLLDIFSIISTESAYLKQRLMEDVKGRGRLLPLLIKAIDMTLFHLLSAASAEKIRQHYLAYAQRNGLCNAEISRKVWRTTHYKLEETLQQQWEKEYAEVVTQEDNNLTGRMEWIKIHFFELRIAEFDTNLIHFDKYGHKESFLMIIFSELLTNIFKYYSSVEKKPVEIAWKDLGNCQLLICRNPSTRTERLASKGSSKGHTFLSALAKKTDSLFKKFNYDDIYSVEISIPNEIMFEQAEVVKK